jgi:hypothetical protein
MSELPLACSEWREHLAGWVVAQLGPDDEAALVAHLDECRGCRVEADSLLAVAAVSLGADPGGEPWERDRDAPPPADLADRIVARVAAERRPRLLARAAIAVATVAVVGLLAGALLGGDPAPTGGEPVAFARVAPGVDAAATVRPDDAGSVIELVADGLDPEVTYALWLTPPGGGYRDRVPAGTFRPDGAGRVDVTLRSALPPDDASRVWATTPDDTVILDTDQR